MARLEKVKQERINKLEALRKAGLHAYPIEAERSFSLGKAVERFSKLEQSGEKVTVAGRIKGIRIHGGVTFFDIKDASGALQVFLRKEEIGEDRYQLFTENLDLGDFIQVEGALFITKAGEQSIRANSLRVLSKALRPLPEEWYGVSEKEVRYRQRYLDLLSNPDVKDRFGNRFNIIRQLRESLYRRDFLEVETPILQTLAGGALAEPFKTYFNALDTELYLRIAPELYLKRLIVGGFEKIFELGKVFRNEGVDREHNPEFTMLELYWAYQNHQGLMEFVQEWLGEVVEQCLGSLQFEFQGNQVNWGNFNSRDFDELLKQEAGVDWRKASAKELAQKAQELGATNIDGLGRGKLADEIFKKGVRGQLMDPIFVTGIPEEISPFAKKDPNSEQAAARFLLVAGGLEIVNGFSEINDPQEQEERFQDQIRQGESGDVEIQPNDQEYVEALEYGMPPAAGLGVGVDRLVMLLTDASSLREVILFPTMRPRSRG